jgi:flagellin-like hook-associated protein FlgL
MASSINPIPAVSAESPNRSLSEFSQSLEKLSSGLQKSGVGTRPADYADREDRKVQAAELSKQVRDTNDAVTEARTADEGLKQLDGLLSQARGLVFGGINEPGRKLKEEDQAEFSKVLQRVDQVASSLVFGGGPLLAGSASFGAEGNLAKADVSNFEGSIGAIQVVDRAISEVGDQRGLLGIFQSNKLAETGRLLRGGLAGVVSSNSVVRDRTVAVNLAQSAAGELVRERESSLLGSGNTAGQILASIVGRL